MFKYLKNERGGTPSYSSVLTKDGEQYKRGMLITAGGDIVTGSAEPDYLVTEEVTGGEGVLVSAVAISHDDIYIAELSEDGAAIKCGDKLNVSDDGLCVTAVTGGTAKVIWINGTDIGSEVYVKF